MNDYDVPLWIMRIVRKVPLPRAMVVLFEVFWAHRTPCPRFLPGGNDQRQGW